MRFAFAFSLSLLIAGAARAEETPGSGQAPPVSQREEQTVAPSVARAWTIEPYGFIELDVVYDTTQSFEDLGGWGSAAIAPRSTYAGSRDRLQLTARDSRLGIVIEAPEYGSLKASGTLEGDFMGSPASSAAEPPLLSSSVFRLRVAALFVQSDVVDVLAGQGWCLFGFQPHFLPASAFILPFPGQVFKRDAQLRVSRRVWTTPWELEVGASVNRPPQRDSGVPDLQAGARVVFDGWRGIHSPGADGQRLIGSNWEGPSFAMSGAWRRFRVRRSWGESASEARDLGGEHEIAGKGLALDAKVPIIPTRSPLDRANALTLTLQLSVGAGHADLLGGLVGNMGGVATPKAPYPALPDSSESYHVNVPPGLLTYDALGEPHAIQWQTFLMGAEYYLPPSGRVFVSSNYVHAHSSNVARWADEDQLAAIYYQTRYVEGNVFWQITPSLRLAASGQRLEQRFANGSRARHVRSQLSAYLSF